MSKVSQATSPDTFIPWVEPRSISTGDGNDSHRSPVQSPRAKTKPTTPMRKTVSPSNDRSPKKESSVTTMKTSPGKKRGIAFSKEDDLKIIKYYISLGKTSEVQKLLPERASSSLHDRCKKLTQMWVKMVE